MGWKIVDLKVTKEPRRRHINNEHENLLNEENKNARDKDKTQPMKRKRGPVT